MNEHAETLEYLKKTGIDLAVQFGPRLLVAIGIIIVGVVVGRWVGQFLDKTLQKLNLEPPVRLLLLRIAKLMVIGLFVIMALQNLGVQLLPLIAGIGVAGAGIALAMQGILGNMLAGLTIIFTKPFRIGEYISIAGVEGDVENINLFTTILSHPDKSNVVVPNRKIVGEILHNYGRIRQLNLVVGVSYDTDLNVALSTVNEVLQNNARVKKDLSAVIAVSVLADSSINIAVKPWTSVADFGPAGGEINKALVEAFRAKNITIPFPQREIRMLGGSK
ncbi:MAG TPA: mechanosensitive ion channel protein MscS [Lentisphaeria bacterium]|nr:MAG: mechanosensitive ion channel protein MscS [Lentisphaerae bacterium GWF2_50_93]HCE45257.1 mechanosensitive ion channel protein MscS [Lentisphaeria bacterium]